MSKSILIVLWLLMAATSHAQPHSTVEQNLHQTITGFFESISKRDTAGIKMLSTADIKLFEYGEVWTIDSLFQKLLPVFRIPDYKRTNQFNFVQTAINRNTAWVTYYLQSGITLNGKTQQRKWMETVILVKEKGRWKIKLLHSSRLEKV
jgi:Domain of unknown function (DUF4440)